MILVTAAAGKTGRAIVAALADRGLAVHALVRRPEAAGAVEALGPTVKAVVADLGDAAALAHAAVGASAIYYIAPNMSPLEGLHGANVIAAARAAGVDRLVFHSVLHTQVQALRHHWNRLFVEESIVESGLPYTILQVGSYMQNMLPAWPRMLETGVHAMAYGVDVPMSLVDLDDVTTAASAVLADPGYANGIFELCGPAITLRDKAAILTRLLGRPVRAEKLPAEAAVEHARHAGAGPFAQDCMRRMFAHYDVHGLVGSPKTLGWILGRPPTDFEAFVRRVVSLQP